MISKIDAANMLGLIALTLALYNIWQAILTHKFYEHSMKEMNRRDWSEEQGIFLFKTPIFDRNHKIGIMQTNGLGEVKLKLYLKDIDNKQIAPSAYGIHNFKNYEEMQEYLKSKNIDFVKG